MLGGGNFCSFKTTKQSVLASFYVAPVNPPAGALRIGAFLRHKSLNQQLGRQPSVAQKEKIGDYALNSSSNSSHRGGGPAVAGKSLYSDAGIYQVDP
jgi:hypothetical protein